MTPAPHAYRVRALRRKGLRYFASDHEGDYFRRLFAGHRKCLDVLSISKNRTDISQRRYLVHSMRDIDNGQPSITKLSDYFVELIHVPRSQGRRGLIQDNQARFPIQGLRDFPHLSTRQRQILGAVRRVDIRAADLMEDLSSPFPLSRLIDQSKPFRRVDDR